MQGIINSSIYGDPEITPHKFFNLWGPEIRGHALQIRLTASVRIFRNIDSSNAFGFPPIRGSPKIVRFLG